ncbi:uncharacterized protein PHACADRAFT_265150 [Phanerochaete carnosa HHB-10118-sp]|uniref:Uncharacterized protein n=1 Tax=Phanerochaete carnosa (strain HHB-10118-sp) TaxID=650164 RepID=K5VEL8_PHACS|nr:uncharacterized protein PHACADRAFT_265150 [Phanerochaete carnosa HHB-10118-sp]EKM49608.1 hypothetical protein PHACADRAFT_265150 [Phanerochaete carnosa HHB-10118-sp]
MSQSWAPDETSAQLWLDRINLVGVELGNIAYGVHITLFFLCFIAWWSARRHSPKSAYSMLAFISCVFVLGSIGNGTQMRLLQMAYVDDRDYPGGPGAFETYEGSVKVNVIGTAAYTVNAWFSDGLLLYRFSMLWSTSRYRWVVIPALLGFMLSVISSSILLSQIADPGGALWISSSANMALTFWSASISVTCYCTLGIVAKLLYMRHQIRKVFSANEPDSPYFSAAAMLIESALLYAAFALSFLITYAEGNTASLMLFSMLGQVQSIAPLLIVLRVAQGRGWTIAKVRETERLAMNTYGTQTIKFHHPTHSTANGSATVADSATNPGEMECAEGSVASLSGKEFKGAQLEHVVDTVAEHYPNGEPPSNV